MASRSNLRLVSFDGGGGVRSLSQLEIMATIMHRLKNDRYSHDPDKVMLPCEHFHLMGGSGTGGLIAIMLSKLRMSVEEASAEFLTIVKEVYEPNHPSPVHRTRKLKECMENLMRKRGLPIDLELYEKLQVGRCASFVVASLRASATSKVALRSYPVRSRLPSGITVIDAVLATCAVQPEFAPVSSGSDHEKREYIAVGLGGTNPVRSVITEALELFDGYSSVAFLLSLGTGNPGAIPVPLDSKVDAQALMRAMMNDCDERAQEIERQIGGVGIYFRFSVDQGMQYYHGGRASNPSWIATQASVYTSDPGTSRYIDALLHNFDAAIRHVTLDQLEYVGGTSVAVQSSVTLDMILAATESVDRDALLAKLRPADLDCGPQVAGCMEGTRQDVLARILDWTTDVDAPNILWLKGHPGVGKSAIATSLVEHLSASKRLGSSFFYQRQRATVLTPSAMWRTVASDLARRYPTVGKRTTAALRADEAITTTSNVDRLFRQLVQEPLMASEEIPVERLPIVVIDALDECGGLGGQYSAHRENLMRTVRKWSGLPRKFKLFVTSRGELDITLLFSTVKHHSIEILAGHTVDAQSSEDIQKFLTVQLQQIAFRHPRTLSCEWPGTQIIETLATKAAGLFIWAETVVRFIQAGAPNRLNLVLQGAGASGMAKLYEEILSTYFHELEAKEIGDLCSVMGTIILAKAPLSLSSLALLLSIDESTVEQICNGLESVLESRGTLQFRHQSFVDFLLYPGRTNSKFIINVKQEGRNLTLACFQVMKSHLRFNICGLKSSYFHNNEVPDLDLLVTQCIPPHVSYSSHFWASHLADTTFDIEIFGYVQYFTQNQFLLWWEVLSLTKWANHASSMLLLLLDWIQAAQQDDAMARDMHKFARAFCSAISQSVPHIYLSALPFSPPNSTVSRQYMGNYPQTLSIQTGGLSHWPSMQNMLTGHINAVTCVVFSPDGKRLVSSSDDRTIRVWDAETGEELVGPLEGHSDPVQSVAFSPDGNRIVSGSRDKTIRVWDAKTGEEIVRPLEGHSHWVSSVAFSSDGKRIVSGSYDTTIRVWDAQTGEEIVRPMEGHSDPVHSVAFSPDGKQIVSGSRDCTIRVWDAEMGEEVVGPLEGHSHWVNSVAFSPDGKRIVSGSFDTTVRVWDAKTGEIVTGPFEGHDGCIKSVAFSPNGKCIVSGSFDTTIRVWNVETGEAVAGPLEGHNSFVMSVAFSPEGNRIVSGSSDKTIRLWDAPMGEEVAAPLEGHSHWVSSVAFSPDGKRIVSGSYDETIRVWDAETGEELVGPLEGHNAIVNCVTFSPDGRRIVSSSDDKTIRVWDAKTGEEVIGPLRGHSDLVQSVALSLDGKRVVSGSSDGTIRVWDSETGEEIVGPLEGHGDPVQSVAFSPDGRRIVSSSDDKTIRVWDAKTGEEVVGPWEGHSDVVGSVAFSPDGKRIVSGSYDETIRVWDAETGEELAGPLEGHSGVVRSVAFSPDGSCIASGSFDTTVRVWDAETGEVVAGPFTGQSEEVYSVAFSPDGKRLVSGSGDKMIRVWDVIIGGSENLDDIRPSFIDRSEMEDGWVLGSHSELLFWVPPALRTGLFWPNTRLIMGKFTKTKLDLQRFVHGESWSQCAGATGI